MTSSPRARACLLREAALVLSCSDEVVSSAASFCFRCLSPEGTQTATQPEPSVTGVPSWWSELSLVAASLFLAAKTCEEPRRIRDVINAVHLAGRGVPLRDSRLYWTLKEDLVLMEQKVLRSLGFDVGCTSDAQVLLLNFLRFLRAPPPLFRLTVAIANDSTASPVCTALPSRVLVAAVVGISAQMLGVGLPGGWRDVLEVQDDDAFKLACHAVLDVYDDDAHASGRQEGGVEVAEHDAVGDSVTVSTHTTTGTPSSRDARETQRARRADMEIYVPPTGAGAHRPNPSER